MSTLLTRAYDTTLSALTKHCRWGSSWYAISQCTTLPTYRTSITIEDDIDSISEPNKT